MSGGFLDEIPTTVSCPKRGFCHKPPGMLLSWSRNAKTLLRMSLKTVIKFFVVHHVIAKGPYYYIHSRENSCRQVIHRVATVVSATEENIQKIRKNGLRYSKPLKIVKTCKNPLKLPKFSKSR